MYNERVTSLESHANCPYKFDKIKFDGSNLDTIIAMYTGDILHIAHQYPELADEMCDQFFDITLPAMVGIRDNLKKEQLHKMIELARLWIEEFKDNQKYFEVKNTVVINNMIVTGGYDCLIFDNDGMLHLFDFKTTKSISLYNNRIEKKQILIYAYMVMKKFQVDSIRVSYQIYVKGKDNNKAKVVRKTKILYLNDFDLLSPIDGIDNVEKQVFEIIDNYKLSKDMGIYWTKPINEDNTKCSSCFYCPMRDKKHADEAGLEICPAMIDTSSFDIE